MENDVLYNRIMNVVHKEYGDGSTAVANPEGEPTDSLETIQIGDDVYSISGGGGGAFIVHSSMGDSGLELDKTWQEIFDALKSGKPSFKLDLYEGESPDDNFCTLQPIVGAEGIDVDQWCVYILLSTSDSVGVSTFTAETKNDYPVQD